MASTSSSNGSGGAWYHDFTRWCVVCPPSMARSRPSDVAFGVWSVQDADQQNAVAQLPSHERDKVFADLSGNPKWWTKVGGRGQTGRGSNGGGATSSPRRSYGHGHANNSSQRSLDLSNHSSASVSVRSAGGTSYRHRQYTTNEDIPDAMDEAPLFVENCLLKMDQEINRIVAHHKNPNNINSQHQAMSSSVSAFRQAQMYNPNYVNDRSFRLMFLRADEFNCKKSAQRIVDHFECKLEFFGAELLTKDISYGDLSIEEQNIVKSGNFQFLPETDHAGRRIWFHRVARSNFQNPNSEVRCQHKNFQEQTILRFENIN